MPASSAPDDVPARRTYTRALATFAAFAFAFQFALLDVTFRGAAAYAHDPRRLGDALASAALWGVAVTGLARIERPRARRAVRVALAIVAAALIASQALVFRYYQTPIDVQVAASAIHAWHDVRPVVLRAAPVLLASIAALAFAEALALRFAERTIGTELRRSFDAALAGAAFGGLVSPGPRRATPDISAFHAVRALAVPAPPRATGAVALPPLLVERELPSVLFVLTESVRASDYRTEGAEPTAAATVAVTPGRVDLGEMRAVSSYTAVSLSALLTGLSQEGPRDVILAAPSLFDYARAARDRRGERPFVAYYSAQSETVFESNGVRASVDHFVTVETMRGRDVEDDADYAELPLDRDIVRRFVDELPSLRSPTVAMLHLVGTHAPYFVDPARAPFRPFDHVVTWTGMTKLHAAYEDAIYAQDALVAEAVRAFVAHAGTRPWLVVFTSDHGEAFGENGAIHHGQNLMDEQVHVPGWIASSDGALDGQAQRALADNRTRFVTHLDVLPTILDAMGLWESTALESHRKRMRGASLLQPLRARAPIPVTNCTGMFPCPLNTWGLYGEDRKLVARLWDGGWTCLVLGGGEERVAGPADEKCAELRRVSQATFPLLPNGQPNR